MRIVRAGKMAFSAAAMSRPARPEPLDNSVDPDGEFPLGPPEYFFYLLYQAARQQSPISVMFQLGEVETQVMAVYLKSVIPEVPEFDDGDNRLQWKFRASRAQGTVDDEISVAFA